MSLLHFCRGPPFQIIRQIYCHQNNTDLMATTCQQDWIRSRIMREKPLKPEWGLFLSIVLFPIDNKTQFRTPLALPLQ